MKTKPLNVGQYRQGEQRSCEYALWSKREGQMVACGEAATCYVNQAPLLDTTQAHTYLCDEHWSFFHAARPQSTGTRLVEVQ